MKRTAYARHKNITPPPLYNVTGRSRTVVRVTARRALGLFSRAYISYAPAHGADTRLLVADFFPPTGGVFFRLKAEELFGGESESQRNALLNEFSEKTRNRFDCEEYLLNYQPSPAPLRADRPKNPLRPCTFQTLLADAFAKKVDTFAVADKYEFGATNSLPALDKYEFDATNSFPAFDKHEFGAANSFSAFDKYAFGAPNSFSAPDKCEFGATNSFPATDKYEFGAQNSFPALNKYKFGAANSFSAFNKHEFGAHGAGAGFPVRASVYPETTAAHAAAQSYKTRRIFMKEIQTVYVSGMNNAAHFLFVSNMAERAEKDAAVSEKCAAQVKALREAVQAEDENLQVSAKSLTTDKIAEADRLRDQLYAGYKKAVAGYAGFPVESMAEAAKVLQQHVKDYKIDVQAQLDKETGLLVNFIQDLEGKFAEQVKELSLGAFVEKLKAANEDVRALTGQRTDERSAKTAGALKTARAASDEAYRMLVLHVNAHALLEGEEAYAAFIDYANTEIEHFRKEVLGGKKKATSAE